MMTETSAPMTGGVKQEGTVSHLPGQRERPLLTYYAPQGSPGAAGMLQGDVSVTEGPREGGIHMRYSPHILGLIDM